MQFPSPHPFLPNLLLFPLLFLPSRLFAQQANPLEEITEAHIRWRDSLVNFRLKSEHVFENGHAASKEPGATKGTVKDHYDWIWTDSGKARRYNWRTIDGTHHSDTLIASDGRKQMHFRYPRGDPPRKPAMVTISPGHGMGMRHIFAPFYGLWYPNKERWLADLLEADQAEFLGYETVDGVRCPQIKVYEISIKSGRTLETYLTLDPRHGFMPLKKASLPGKGADFARSGFGFAVKSFQYLNPPGIWMPKKGMMEAYTADGEIYHRKHWTITDIQINQKLSPKLFEPPIPAGTQVINALADKSAYYQGGQPGDWYPRNASEGSPPVEGDGDISGEPRSGFWSQWGVLVLVMLSFVFLLIAMRLHKRRPAT